MWLGFRGTALTARVARVQWGEPLKETKEQIDRVYAQAEKAGRTDRPRIWVTFRPIIAPTEELAWAKAHETLDRLNANKGKASSFRPNGNEKDKEPQNVGSQRVLDIAKRGEVQDRALWYPTVSYQAVLRLRREQGAGLTEERVSRSPPPERAERRPRWWARPRLSSTRSWTTSSWAATSSPSAVMTT
jgi:alkanesulfonate monooxygenase SsuD/methylene tetrahydromethanopterin reductase-like flavin-dependent oxidoreductase (luciferase family)